MNKVKYSIRISALVLGVSFQVLACSMIVTYTKYLEAAYGVSSLSVEKPTIFWFICLFLVLIGNTPFALMILLSKLSKGRMVQSNSAR